MVAEMHVDIHQMWSSKLYFLITLNNLIYSILGIIFR